MESKDTIILGIMQGLTEFLPVSSSGHLAIAQHFMDFQQAGLLFDTLLHFATLLAVVIYFRRRIGVLVLSFLGLFIANYRLMYIENKRFLWGIIIATIPTGIIGLLLERFVMDMMSAVSLVGYALIVTSILLVLSDRFGGSGKVTNTSSVILGIVQGLAVIPGISRSGSTIAIAVMLGISRREAAEFSFLMSIPAILGATILQLQHINSVTTSELSMYSFGMIAAFISGLLAIKVMMIIVEKAKLTFFALYCLIVGIITVVFI